MFKSSKSTNQKWIQYQIKYQEKALNALRIRILKSKHSNTKTFSMNNITHSSYPNNGGEYSYDLLSCTLFVRDVAESVYRYSEKCSTPK